MLKFTYWILLTPGLSALTYFQAAGFLDHPQRLPQLAPRQVAAGLLAALVFAIVSTVTLSWTGTGLSRPRQVMGLAVLALGGLIAWSPGPLAALTGPYHGLGGLLLLPAMALFGVDAAHQESEPDPEASGWSSLLG